MGKWAKDWHRDVAFIGMGLTWPGLNFFPVLWSPSKETQGGTPQSVQVTWNVKREGTMTSDKATQNSSQFTGINIRPSLRCSKTFNSDSWITCPWKRWSMAGVGASKSDKARRHEPARSGRVPARPQRVASPYRHPRYVHAHPYAAVPWKHIAQGLRYSIAGANGILRRLACCHYFLKNDHHTFSTYRINYTSSEHKENKNLL